MKIVKLEAENFKKLVAVQIKPDGNVVEITGKNGQGKTSILDAIWVTLAGMSVAPVKPIRKGETSARIRLDLGEIKVERRFTEKGSAIHVENADGARFPTPQRMLDDLIGALSFDPLAFARKPAKEQVNELRSVAKLEVDFDKLDGLSRADYAERTDLNRQAKAKKAQAEGIVVPVDLPAEPVDEKALLDQITEASNTNAARERERLAREKKSEAADRAWEEGEDCRAEAARLMQEAERVAKKGLEAEKRHEELQREIAALPALPAPIEIKDLRAKLEDAQTVNKQIARRTQKQALEKEAADLEAQAQTCTSMMEAREETKRHAIANAKMPVEGLGFGDGTVTFNGIPLEQCSSAEQLRISLAIAMAANPKLRVIRIQDGSLLDDDSLKIIGEMAEAGDFQVWIERVDTSGNVGFIIEDGHARRAGEVAQPVQGAA